jgi:hypothetical protein
MPPVSETGRYYALEYYIVHSLMILGFCYNDPLGSSLKRTLVTVGWVCGTTEREPPLISSQHKGGI